MNLNVEDNLPAVFEYVRLSGRFNMFMEFSKAVKLVIELIDAHDIPIYHIHSLELHQHDLRATPQPGVALWESYCSWCNKNDQERSAAVIATWPWA